VGRLDPAPTDSVRRLTGYGMRPVLIGLVIASRFSISGILLAGRISDMGEITALLMTAEQVVTI